MTDYCALSVMVAVLYMLLLKSLVISSFQSTVVQLVMLLLF